MRNLQEESECMSETRNVNMGERLVSGRIDIAVA